MWNPTGRNKGRNKGRNIGRHIGAERLAARLAVATQRPQRGAQTTEYMLWVAVTIVVVGAVGVIFKNSLVTFFNGLVYDIGFSR